MTTNIVNARNMCRVWDNDAREWLTFEPNYDYNLFIDYATGELVWQSRPDGEDEWPKELDTSTLDVDHCIGWQDCNGKWIFERDRIKPYYDECHWAEIRWNHEKAAWGIWVEDHYDIDTEGGYGAGEEIGEHWDEDCDLEYMLAHKEIEVIGNAHEMENDYE